MILLIVMHNHSDNYSEKHEQKQIYLDFTGTMPLLE